MSSYELVKALARLGYVVKRQTGSHMRLTTQLNGKHHITIPAHAPIKVGTLSAILSDVGTHADLSRDELLEVLFS